MIRRFHRQLFFLLAGAATLIGATMAAGAPAEDGAEVELARLEKSFGGRLGVFALNTGNGAEIAFRADERFPVCSTFKVMVAGAILERSTKNPDVLKERLHYAKSELVAHSPVTETQVDDGMTVAELCAAAIQYSDNTAGNVLMKFLGGPAAVTAFARSIGNAEFRLDRWETELNTAIPGDPRDTATAASMARSLQKLALGDALPPATRDQLNEWLRGNKTGAKRIRAGIPGDWKIGDKTGSGDYGTANDIAVLWPPKGKPIVLAIYSTQNEAKAAWRDDILAEAAKIVARRWAGAR